VSQHLRVLRESGFATVRADGSRRLYSVNPGSLDEAERWIAGVRQAWEQRLDALGTELARGARQRRIDAEGPEPNANPKSKGKDKGSRETRRKR
jgi:DNA-binding transcriptional ArsR family regulator